MRGEARRLSVQIMDRESTGRRIKAARQLAHLTVPQFAARLDLPGLGAKTLGSIERGERELRPQEVEPIASALGVPTVFLVGENPAGASDPLAARLDAYGELIAKQNDLLEQQSRILERIEERLKEGRSVRDEIAAVIESRGRDVVQGLPEDAPSRKPKPRRSRA